MCVCCEGSPSRKISEPSGPTRSVEFSASHSYSLSLNPSSTGIVRNAETIWSLGVGSAGAAAINSPSGRVAAVSRLAEAAIVPTSLSCAFRLKQRFRQQALRFRNLTCAPSQIANAHRHLAIAFRSPVFVALHAYRCFRVVALRFLSVGAFNSSTSCQRRMPPSIALLFAPRMT